MSASLDKSLDDIISSGRKTFKSRRPGAKVGAGSKSGNQNRVGKKLGGSNNKKQIVKTNKKNPTIAAVASTPAFDLSYATKVNVSGLPKDLKHDNIKDFFQQAVGGVQTVALSYNEKGQFKGFATVIFRSSKFASIAVEKYNGAAIDGGAAKLKLELVIDTSKKPLAARIAPNAKPVGPKSAGAKKVAAAKAALNKKKAGPGKNQNQNKPKGKPKPKKKTIEELDQEMADYFDN